MPLSFDWSSFGEYHTDQARILYGLDITLDKDSVAPDKDLLVYSDVVRVQGTLINNGRDVYIHARQLIGGTDGWSVINVSGRPGAPLPGDRATDGSPDHPDASNGRPGNPGLNSGRIRLTIG